MVGSVWEDARDYTLHILKLFIFNRMLGWSKAGPSTEEEIRAFHVQPATTVNTKTY